MAQFKRIPKRIFFLPPLPTVLISVPSFALVIFVLVTDRHSGDYRDCFRLSALYSCYKKTAGKGGAGDHPVDRRIDEVKCRKQIASQGERGYRRREPCLCQGLLL